MLVTLLQILQVIILVLIPLVPGVGICLYLAYYFLVPTMELTFWGFDAVGTSVLFALVFIVANAGNVHKIKKMNFSPLVPFVVLYSILLVLTIFSSKLVPLDFSLKNYVRFIIQTFVIPVAIYMTVISNPGIFKKINRTMILIITITVVYGLVLTIMPGTNPYIEMLSGVVNLQEIHLGSDEGRMFGAISSVFVHPMSFGVMLGFSFCYLQYLKRCVGMNREVYIALSLLILLCTLVCGVRSSLVALMGTGAVYLMFEHKFSLLMKAALVVGLVVFGLGFVPELDTYVGSIFQMESDDVAGSSINMRLMQLNASIYEIRNNLLFGNGYAWHSYYIYLHDGYGHPVLHGWESLLFVTITDSGFVGVGVWIAFIVYYCRKFQDVGIICLFAYSMIYRFATGLFGESLFYIFLVLFICAREVQTQKKIVITKKKL